MTRVTESVGAHREIAHYLDRLPRHGFNETQARAIAAEIGLHFATAPFDLEAFRHGLEVELEHGLRDPETNVTNDDPCLTGKIVWAHLKERPDYYDLLEILEGSPSEPAR